jgi:hypothetical protein
VAAALANQGLSATQIAAAIAAAQSTATGGLTQAELASTLAADGLTATQIADALAAALPQGSQTLTPAQITAAVSAAFPALGAYSGGQALTTWEKPVVGDFAGLFSTFLENMKNHAFVFIARAFIKRGS